MHIPIFSLWQVRLAFWGLLFSLLAIVFTYPAITSLTTNFIGAGGDNYQYAGFQSLVQLNLEAGQLPFADNLWWRYPQGFAFSRGYDSVLSNLFGGILSSILNDYVLAYNLVILFSLIFNAVTAFLLFQYLSKRTLLALLGSIAVGFSFYNLARALGHANLLLTGGFSLLVLTTFKLYYDQSTKNVLFGFASLLLVGLSSVQYFVMAHIVGAVSLLFAWTLYRKDTAALLQKLSNTRRQIIFGYGCVLLFLAPFYIPYALAVIQGDLAWQPSGIHTYLSPSLVDYMVPNSASSTILHNLSPVNWDQRNIEHVVFVGWVELTAFVAVLFIFWKDKLLRFLSVLGGVFWIFSLGTVNPDTGLIMPYYWLIQIYPFKVVAEPSRFIVWTNLFLVGGIIWGLGKLKFSPKQLNYVVIIGLVLVILERISWQGFPMSSDIKGEYVNVVQKLPGKAVFDIPLFDERYNLLPLLYEKSILNGYMHWLGDTNATRQFLTHDNQIVRFDCNKDDKISQWMDDTQVVLDHRNINSQMLERLKKYQVETIVVHKDFKLDAENCRNVQTYVNLLFPQTSLAVASKEKHMMQLKYAGDSLSAVLYFPQKGSLILEGFHFGPFVEKKDLEVRLDDQVFDITDWYYEIVDNQVRFNPPKPIFIDVASGSRLYITQLNTSKKNEVGFVSAWYYYGVDVNAASVPLRHGRLEKVYEDSQKDVYYIWK